MAPPSEASFGLEGQDLPLLLLPVLGRTVPSKICVPWNL